ncbi:hypothetical protein OIU85_026646 [Salix viminalis]|uniref:DUF7599 domain-containing protein n=1 Tax=Salix viminalis TaxID=40686 RepID=A0A9Q0TP17_SALVM|nr:hypothetical protein OIU85_026646 [Salix viminalis]
MLIFLLLKLLVISDIKQGLGYSGTKGHGTWRNILRCVVEEFEAKVDGKAECCPKFVIPPKNFESKTRGCDSEVLDPRGLLFTEVGIGSCTCLINSAVPP